jgi:hypothetical protein
MIDVTSLATPLCPVMDQGQFEAATKAKITIDAILNAFTRSFYRIGYGRIPRTNYLKNYNLDVQPKGTEGSSVDLPARHMRGTGMDVIINASSLPCKAAE